MKNRHYEAPPAEVFDAAVEVFKLADGSDFRISYVDEETMQGTRWAAPFPANIFFTWDVKVTPTPQGSDVNVSISSLAQAFLVNQHQAYDAPASLDLFFSRMDYLLGDGAWQTCAEYEETHPDAVRLDALCMLAKDDVPKGVKGDV